MNVCFTREELCEIFSSSIERWKNPGFNIYPCFLVEKMYLQCFHYYIRRMDVEPAENLVPLISEKFRSALNNALHNVCKVLAQYPVDGISIFTIIDEHKFIFMKDRKQYNRKIAGKTPKGLKTEQWEEYNHWLLANLYWDGFLQSQEAGFQILFPENTEGPIELLLATETKPLWGMRYKALEAGIPILGSYNDCINVHPYISVGNLFEKGVASRS